MILFTLLNCSLEFEAGAFQSEYQSAKGDIIEYECHPGKINVTHCCMEDKYKQHSCCIYLFKKNMIIFSYEFYISSK